MLLLLLLLVMLTRMSVRRDAVFSRYKMLGNSLSVTVVQALLARLLVNLATM